jgi:hypothetical protein
MKKLDATKRRFILEYQEKRVKRNLEKAILQ